MSDRDVDEQSLVSRAPKGDPNDAFGQPVTQRIPVKEIHSKYSTKYELYRFLASRNNVYLPHHRHVTIYFLKEILSGRKMRKLLLQIMTFLPVFVDIDGQDVKTLNVPYYETLTLAKMWEFAAAHPEV